MDYVANLKNLQYSFVSDSLSSDSETIIQEKKDYSSDMESFMNKTVVNMYSRTWGRLEKKLKTNKLNEFLERVKKENSLSTEKTLELKELIFNLLSSNKINKASELKYDKEKCEILEIIGLKFTNNNFEYKRKK